MPVFAAQNRKLFLDFKRVERRPLVRRRVKPILESLLVVGEGTTGDFRVASHIPDLNQGLILHSDAILAVLGLSTDGRCFTRVDHPGQARRVQF